MTGSPCIAMPCPLACAGPEHGSTRARSKARRIVGGRHMSGDRIGIAKSQIDAWTILRSQGKFGPLGFAAKARFGWLSPLLHRFLGNPAASSARPEIEGVSRGL